MKKLMLLATFFVSAPLIFLFTLLFYFSVSYQQPQGDSLLLTHVPPDAVSYAALETTRKMALEEIMQNDARLESVRHFLARYDSPLEPYAKDLVAAADQYDLDYRLLPAIAMQESNLCKKTPKESFNCWGFGIYGKKVLRFDNYADAIQAVTKTLAQEYIQQGLETPEQIMKRYTPNNDGSWAFAVNHFMQEL